MSSKVLRRGLFASVCASLADAAGEDCWGGDFNEALCCGDRWGLVGNPACWDEEFTYLRCCGIGAFPRRPQDNELWEQDIKDNVAKDFEEDFDFIVVGAGSAGSVVAARLAAANGPDGEPWRVLLLEAGPDAVTETADPDRLPQDDLFWRRSVEAKWTLNKESRSWSYRTGQGLGGTASVNSMIYTRGSLTDYAQFGWSDEEVLSGFKALEEGMEVPGFTVSPGPHRTVPNSADASSGPQGYHLTLVSALPEELPPLFRAILESFEQAGVPYRVDPHANGSMHGIGGMWRSMGCGHAACQPTRVARTRHALGRPRSSTYTALITPLNRTGGYRLRVVPETTVERVIFDDADKGSLRRAVGVQAQVMHATGGADRRERRRLRFRAKREVIVAAGVLSSPQLLTISGVGEPDELRALGVPLVASAPDVGRHFHEHVGVSIVATTSMPCPAGYHQGENGKTTHLGNFEEFIGQLYAFLNVTDNNPGTQGPSDAEVMLLEGCLDGYLSLTFTLILLQARTRGRIVVQSRNPATFVHLDYKPLANAEDIDLLATLIRTLYTKVFTSPQMQGFELAATPPWDVVAEFWELASWIRNNIYYYAHPTGTCRVKRGASSGVVDSQLKVLGTSGLRVADASVFAESPSGHSDAPARLVGELAARFILQDHSVGNDKDSVGVGAPWVVLHGYKGVRMPLRGLGTNGFEGEQVRHMVSHFLRLGGRHIDTALLYNNHKDIGVAIKESGVPRDEVFLVSKVPPGEMGLAETSAAVDRAVNELGTHLDLILIHWPANFDEKAPLPACAQTPSGSWRLCRAAAWRALEDSYKRGQVRALGVSNFGPRHLTELLDEPRRSLAIAVNQVEFHPWWPQSALRKLCNERRIVLTAYGSLGGSLLGGAMLRAPAVASVANEIGRSPAQVLLRWAVQQGVAVIPSTTSDERRAQNFDVADWSLADDQIQRIAAVAPQDRMRVFLPDPEHAP